MGPAHLTIVRHEARLEGPVGGIVSLIPLHGPATGVTTAGLLYPLADEDLAAGSTRGVSNELTGPVATVTIRGGVLAAVQPGSLGTHQQENLR
jgi:thiamine pyrophosphokinase